VVAFLRCAPDPDNHLVVVCNFTPLSHTGYRIGSIQTMRNMAAAALPTRPAGRRCRRPGRINLAISRRPCRHSASPFSSRNANGVPTFPEPTGRLAGLRLANRLHRRPRARL
jgi:hypothetical protein